MQSKDLAARFEAYSDWRRRLSTGVSRLHEWLSEQELADGQADLTVQRLLERLHQDKLVVAFVALFATMGGIGLETFDDRLDLDGSGSLKTREAGRPAGPRRRSGCTGARSPRPRW